MINKLKQEKEAFKQKRFFFPPHFCLRSNTADRQNLANKGLILKPTAVIRSHTIDFDTHVNDVEHQQVNFYWLLGRNDTFRPASLEV